MRDRKEIEAMIGIGNVLPGKLFIEVLLDIRDLLDGIDSRVEETRCGLIDIETEISKLKKAK